MEDENNDNNDNTGVVNNTLYDDSDTPEFNTGIDLFSAEVSDTVVLNSNSSQSENNLTNNRQLVVVSVRGSVTFLDWAMDLLTQFHVCFGDFDIGAQMVIDSLYGYDCCTKCDGDDAECECNGYLALNNT